MEYPDYPSIIRVDGTIETYLPGEGRFIYTLEELQAAIGGGYIQLVMTHGDKRMLVLDEDGKAKGFPVNPVATSWYKFGEDDPIVGDVLICVPARID